MTKVYVVDAGRKFYYLQWVDPETGTRITRSSKETTRRGAERRAMEKEKELAAPKPMEAAETWDAFVDYYQTQHLDGLARKSELKSVSVLEAFAAAMKPHSIRHVTTPMLTAYATGMRQAGKSEATIAGHLTTLRAALSWARQQGYIVAVPPIPRVQRSLSGRKAKGRPLTIPEFVRMLRAVPQIVDAAAVESWRNLLIGLWLSGLRISEALRLSWDDPRSTRIDTSGPRPLMRVVAGEDKGHRDRTLPITPDFARWLLRTPPAQRTGTVFNPIGKRGHRMVSDFPVVRAVGDIGEAAGIVVDARGKKFASAHDLRRTFGTRWASKVTPQVLRILMRHESINTTMSYYVDIDAAKLTDDLWEKF